MTKKQKVLIFLVIVPLALIQLYNHYLEYSGNWLEDYQNYFKTGFLAISIAGDFCLILLSKKDKGNIWLFFSTILLIALIVYAYFAIAFIKISF